MSKKVTASVLAYEKKLVPSDGFFYGTSWEQRLDNQQCTPLALQEKSVRGTISNRLKSVIANDPSKLDNEIQKPNPQRVDSCALSANQDTLKLQFTLKILSGIKNPSACNSPEFLTHYQNTVQQYITEHGFLEISKRYATNLANGRFLWRNKVGCEQIEIHIQSLTQETSFKATFNPQNHSNFDQHNSESEQLANLIADTLSGNKKYLLLQVTAFAQLGLAQDVYPSEELVLDKSTDQKGKKSKTLYQVQQTAAMHSQKIGNAIRTIDTWYPEFTNHQKPISADPYGAVTTLGRAFRNTKEKTDFFTLFDKWILGEPIPEHDQHFVMAVLVRGGVFGESSK